MKMRAAKSAVARAVVLIAFTVGADVLPALETTTGAEQLHAESSKTTGSMKTADEVVQAVNAVDDGQFVTRKMTMELINSRGKSRVRETIAYRKHYDGDKKTVMFFLAPANVRDTAFLTWDYADPAEEDDQWLYLPALRKTRRVSAADRGDYFIGTDFTYEDVKLDGKLSLSDYNFNFHEEAESHSGQLVLVAVPRNEEIAEELGYSKTLLTIDPSNWIVVGAKFWDVKGRPLKRLTATDIRQVDGIWTRHSLEMENLQSGHRSIFTFSEVDYEMPVDDAMFNKRSLQRGH